MGNPSYGIVKGQAENAKIYLIRHLTNIRMNDIKVTISKSDMVELEEIVQDD